MITPLATIKPAVELFTTGQFARLNKNNTVDEYRDECRKIDGFEMVDVKVSEIVTLSPADYDDFANGLLTDYEWLSGKGGSGTRANLREVKYFCHYTDEEQAAFRAQAYRDCVLVQAEGREALAVDPQGYAYARYVGFVAAA